MLMAQDINTTAGMIPQVEQGTHDLPIFTTRCDRIRTPCTARAPAALRSHECVVTDRDDVSEVLPGYVAKEEDADSSYDWPAWKKAAVLVAVCAVSFTTAVTPRTIDQTLTTTQTTAGGVSFGLRNLAKLGLSLYFITLAAGQMLLAPISEVVGRSIVLLLSAMLHLAISVVVLYVHNSVAIVVLRALQGLCASGCLAVALGTLVDIFAAAHRQAAFSALLFVIFLAQAVTPVYSSWISDVAQPHFILTTHVVLSAASTLLLSALIFETRRNVSDDIGTQLIKAVKECAFLLVSDPICLCVAGWLSLTQIASSLSLSTLRFFVGQTIADANDRAEVRDAILRVCQALTLAAACVAISVSYVISALLSHWRMEPKSEDMTRRETRRRARRCGLSRSSPSIVKCAAPETRLPIAALGVLALLVGCILAFIGSRSPELPILAPSAAGSISLGSFLCQLGAFLYLADIYELRTSCAVAAALLFAYVFEAVTPSTGEYLCAKFGVFSVSLAAICTSIVAATIPPLLVIKGAKIRNKSRIANQIATARQAQIALRRLRARGSSADAIALPPVVDGVRLPKYSECDGGRNDK